MRDAGAIAREPRRTRRKLAGEWFERGVMK
jgi:hypothetical protein